MGHPRAALALLAAAALALAGCRDGDGGGQASTPTTGSTAAATETPPPEPLDWNDCERDNELDCTSVTVPLDYHDPDGETLDIAIARRAAGDESRRIGSLLINPGGPGASGIDAVEAADLYLPQSVLERFDVVGFDPRGVGESGQIDCGERFDVFYALDPTPDDDRERTALIDGTRLYVNECQRRSDDILAHVDTVSAAMDMERIRAALGEERISYVGFSYGTFLGATYADLYPERVRAFVLDGAVDPSLSSEQLTETQALGFERGLQAFLDDCAANPGCDFHSGGDPYTAFDELMAAIDREPLTATSVGLGRQVGPGEATTAIAAALYDRESGWPALALGLERARQGDGSVMLRLFDAYTQRHADGTYGGLLEANAAINCLDTPAPKDIAVYDAMYARLRETAPRIGASSAYLGLTCAFWPVDATGTPRALTAEGAPPILVVGTTGDPVTPYSWAQSLASQLSSGALLTWEGESHTAIGQSDCIDDKVSAYLADLTLPEPGDDVCF
jgi:pimeloyl-ACP methyl ester carboxylesterase